MIVIDLQLLVYDVNVSTYIVMSVLDPLDMYVCCAAHILLVTDTLTAYFYVINCIGTAS